MFSNWNLYAFIKNAGANGIDIKTTRLENFKSSTRFKNLLAFSFDEESLIKTTNETQTRSLELNKVLKRQQDL